jgi:membrane protein
MIGYWKKRFAAALVAGSKDNIGILAAGVAYYAFLALVPLLAACVLAYGLFADPESVARHIAALARVLPASAADLIASQLQTIVEGRADRKTLGLLAALIFALFGARNGAASAMTAINLANNREEQRSLVRRIALALAITACAIAGAILVILAIGATALLDNLLPGLGEAGVRAGRVLTYAILLGATVIGSWALYRVAPPGPNPLWSTVMPGALLAGIGGMVATLAFALYVTNFGSYNATYGSLGAVIALLTWLYIVAYLLLLGAELNAAGSAEPRERA